MGPPPQAGVCRLWAAPNPLEIGADVVEGKVPHVQTQGVALGGRWARSRHIDGCSGVAQRPP